jgi:hypothetical protein
MTDMPYPRMPHLHREVTRHGRVVIWYVLIDALVHSSRPRISATWVDRDEGVGSTRDGQAVPYHELRARVVIWPPSRLTRVRCERESVVVV